MRDRKAKNVDPLFQLFEHFLVNRSYEDSEAFTKEVAQGYVAYLDGTTAHIPLHTRQSIIEDLEAEAHEMLVKKMYGVVKETDYENYGRVVKVQKKEIKSIDFTPPPKPSQSEETEEK